jgi:hypothetical protein
MASSRLLIATPRFRWRQVLGWRLHERSDGFSLEPEYAQPSFPARFVGRVEAMGVGSRITGRIVQSFPQKLVAILFIALTAMMGASALAQHGEQSRKVAATSAAMIAVCLGLVRFDLRSTAGLIEAGLRAALDAVPEAGPE